MPALSPILRSSFEAAEHGLWHFFRSTATLDTKLAILHLDQAIELILKERVRRFHISIYKQGNPKETISYWEALRIIEGKGRQIPERADLELLHDERNAIQHKYSTPDPETARWLVEVAVRFLSRFLHDEFDLDLEGYLPLDYLGQILDAEP
jgi:hypothetical protein